MSEVIGLGEGHFGYIGNDFVALFNDAISVKPRQLVDPEVKDNQEIKNWGDDNNYPQWVLEQIKDVTLVEPILEWKARALYSGGLTYGILSVDDKGEEKFKRIIDTEIENWLERTNITHYIECAAINFYTFYNAWAQFTQSRTGEKITYLTALDTAESRLQRKSNKGVIKKLYVSPDWEKYNDKAKETAKFDLYHPIFTDEKEWRTIANHQFAYSLSAPSPGRAYYQKAPWHVILENWLTIARAIPEFKKALLKNQLTIKYIIKVPEWWWEHRYKDWSKKKEKERLALMRQELTDFEDFFSGKKQGNSFMYTQKDSTHTTKYAEWTVEVIDDKVKEGMYIEDSQEADAHIFKNLNVDPTLFGNSTGKDRSGSGSGSDKRVAWNNYILMTKPHQDKILSPLQLVSRWNGWQERLAPNDGEKLVFWMKNYQIARLDSGNEVSESKPTNNPN